jgi:tetratricopeptide (TPR) repeat protein
MDAALARAPESDLLTLNAGALWEAAGTEALARDRYLRALDLNPAQARALFWAQTPLRAGVLAEWQTSRPPDESALAQGWAALNTGELEKARESFQQAQAQSPLSTSPYVGLARAYWALGDEGQAQKYLAEAERLPLVAIRPKIEILLLKGDWAAAHGDGAAAREAYTLVFSAVNDYTSEGPGTYGYPGRSRVVYHRNALPSDLIPQFAYADITPEMDRAFVQLAQWLGDSSESGTACFILARVYREAPQSASGTAWLERCR